MSTPYLSSRCSTFVSRPDKIAQVKSASDSSFSVIDMAIDLFFGSRQISCLMSNLVSSLHMHFQPFSDWVVVFTNHALCRLQQ